MTGIAFVGTGFVADYYMTTLANYPGLSLRGVYDHSAAQLDRFAAYYGARAYRTLDELLSDRSVEIVVNLTTIESHYPLSRAALEAGKHVYSEKPLSETFEQAMELRDMAARKGLVIAGAPANAATPLFDRIAGLFKEGAIGRPKLVYAQMEDGAVFRQNWRDWRSVSGAAWPGEHEFLVGCTLEHVVYALSWLVMLFGPVDSVTAFSALCFPDKGQAGGLAFGPDFSVAMLNFRSGPVARVTTGLAAPKDRSMTIMGDGGTITVEDLWDFNSAARIEVEGRVRSLPQRAATRLARQTGIALGGLAKPGQAITVPSAARQKLPAFPSRIDFSAGIAALAHAIEGGPKPFLSGDMAVHLTELALAISNAGGSAQPYRVRSLRPADEPEPSR